MTGKLLVDINDIKFADGTNNINKNNYTIEDLFSEEDKEKIGITNEDYSKEKAFYSLETLKKLKMVNINIVQGHLRTLKK